MIPRTGAHWTSPEHTEHRGQPTSINPDTSIGYHEYPNVHANGYEVHPKGQVLHVAVPRRVPIVIRLG
jgi:hypothetical protein